MAKKQPSQPRRRSLRWLMLGGLLVLGMALAVLARYRPEAAEEIWGRLHAPLSALLDPIKQQTRVGLATMRRARELWTFEEENRGLRRVAARLEASNRLLAEQLGRVERLTGLARWEGAGELVFMPAGVIGVNTSAGGVLIKIDRGERHGLRPRDAVIALGGVVGVVRSVTGGSAVVQSVSDPLSAVGALTMTGRARGIVYGRGPERALEFSPESEVTPIEIGAVLVTSGFENSMYPKGLPIGTIERQGLDPFGLPFGVVRPAVDFAGLEEVIVVLPAERSEAPALPMATGGEGAMAGRMTGTMWEDAAGTVGTLVEGRGGMPRVELMGLEPGVNLLGVGGGHGGRGESVVSGEGKSTTTTTTSAPSNSFSASTSATSSTMGLGVGP